MFQDEDYNENDLTQINFSKQLKTAFTTKSRKMSAQEMKQKYINLYLQNKNKLMYSQILKAEGAFDDCTNSISFGFLTMLFLANEQNFNLKQMNDIEFEILKSSMDNKH